ncbi:alpha/beta-hydrolase [Trametes versicolor FP-101664 SS1]|uniref:alpha/beta-hydrolase n=1 Tax=Trametes versicolor (strain FP-101664) TaxID=717944 RepID=UPI00046241CC|nr:alpha/beta-hydrolase [Trametes versicolor FP-101664 SS1]EIW63608.1 alpha/beta-hydrolase [Trametes versicolor FP-101664 SS1]
MTRLVLPFIAVLVTLARAAPAPLFGINLGSGDESKVKPTAVSQDDITADILRPALFSRTAYCSAASVTNMSCGAPCDATPNVKVLAAGGDDGAIPGFFIASDPDTQTIVVAHQGTDPNKVLSIANDVEFLQVGANTTLFPQAGDDVKLHSGFQDTQGRTADIVMATVQSGLASTGFQRVLVTGHSLGAAVASLDAAMLRMALPDDVQVDSVVFGLPRVGNQEWADLFDTLIPNFIHVTNQNDPVPNVPPHALDFEHPSGEVHITSVDDTTGNATMVACSGQENQVSTLMRLAAKQMTELSPRP